MRSRDTERKAQRKEQRQRLEPCSPTARNAKGCQQPTEAGKEGDNRLPLRASKREATLQTPQFWPPEL